MARIRLVVLSLVLLTVGVTAVNAQAAPNPTSGSGNNGTVKLDLIPNDDTTPNNQPHVGCPFGVDWHGFDANARTTVEFRIQPPSVGSAGRVLLPVDVYEANGAYVGQTRTDSFRLDGDGPAGGGSQAGWDGSRTYDLTPGLLRYGVYAAGHGTGHPVRLDGKPALDGYHVKMTVRTETANGAITKHKVFWTGLCDDHPTDGD